MRFSIIRLGVLVTLITAFTGCLGIGETPKPAGPWQNWQIAPNAPSPLLGKIWSFRENAFITPTDLAKAMAKADFALLGETHDNADHHRLQGWMVSAIAGQGRKPAVVWEMFDTGQSQALITFQNGKPDNADALGTAVNWGKTGWPQWPLYQPIAEAALSSGLSMYAGDPPVTLVRTVGKKGFSVLPQGETERLLLDKPLAENLKNALQTQIVESHCNLIPSAATGPMYRGQRLRDASMAMHMVEKGETNGAILIAGTGHVRQDRAVPWHLRRLRPGKTVSSLMFVGVSSEETDPASLIPTDPDGKPAADYAWFTPKVVREDPCIALKKRYAK
ncbi:MAG: hypothetical protein COA85_12215 [Robiginitomaculum sp.]|nr:MAG: hypothetical protein COA85_12215 [Robiginitomaculum sp.]